MLAANERLPVSKLQDDYRLFSRIETPQRPHHMISRNGSEVEDRLCQTSLYRPDLDLVVIAKDESVAAYGLFWFDPITLTGLVEPMRTEDTHQQRGLARHILTKGIERLASAGAKRIKVCFKPANEPARNLYVSVGFKPYKRTAMLSRQGFASAA